MKSIIYLTALLLSTILYSQSNERWSHIGDAEPGVSYYITEIKSEYNGSKTFWLKCLELKDSSKKRKGEYSIVKWTMFCNTKKFKFGSYTEYTSDGKTIRSTDLNTEYQEAIPDSLGEKIYNYVCNS